MSNLVKVIGEIVLAIIIIIIPMLTTCSFCLNWLDDTKLFLIILMVADFLFVCAIVDKIANKSTS